MMAYSGRSLLAVGELGFLSTGLRVFALAAQSGFAIWCFCFRDWGEISLNPKPTLNPMVSFQRYESRMPNSKQCSVRALKAVQLTRRFWISCN